MLCRKNISRECSGCMECRGGFAGEKTVFKCSRCGDGICDGEPFWQISEELRLCENCISEAKETARYERKSFVNFNF